MLTCAFVFASAQLDDVEGCEEIAEELSDSPYDPRYVFYACASCPAVHHAFHSRADGAGPAFGDTRHAPRCCVSFSARSALPRRSFKYEKGDGRVTYPLVFIWCVCCLLEQLRRPA